MRVLNVVALDGKGGDILPFKKLIENKGFGVYSGKLGLWMRKVQLKEDHSKRLVVNVSKGVSDGGGGINYANIGSVWLEKSDVEALKFELDQILRSWDSVDVALS
jgi:hypothetical protein